MINIFVTFFNLLRSRNASEIARHEKCAATLPSEVGGALGPMGADGGRSGQAEERWMDAATYR